MSQVILSHIQVKPILAALTRGERSVQTSFDLGLTSVEAELAVREGTVGLLSPDGFVSAETLHHIAESDVSCFVINSGTARKIQAFSAETDRHYSLMPTESAPTMLISGLPMHRIKNTDPMRDTQAKIRAAQPRGHVLDTATGLGYTAIEAAKTAEDVVTIELDPVAQQIARQNPWSRRLFESGNIRQMMGDSFDVVETLETASFARIIHDPPTFSLAGHLYSGEFYRHLYRVLKPGGRLFHYIGDPDSKSGNRTTRGVTERLSKAGFQQVESAKQAFGVVALK